MYSPNHYKVDDSDKILQLVADYSFATLLTPGSTECVTHVPFLLRRSSMKTPSPKERYELMGHMARANPHWGDLQKLGHAKALFHGPHAYISPAWYDPKADNVPTWDYAVVHATGEFRILEDRTEAFSAMEEMVNHFEGKYQTGWSLPRGEAAIEKLMRGIVVFVLADVEFEAKFKLNQKQSLQERQNVAAGLSALPQTNARELARFLQAVGLTRG